LYLFPRFATTLAQSLQGQDEAVACHSWAARTRAEGTTAAGRRRALPIALFIGAGLRPRNTIPLHVWVIMLAIAGMYWKAIGSRTMHAVAAPGG
jgi:hypothetical protein